jgi:penicillin-binding protein 2
MSRPSRQVLPWLVLALLTPAIAGCSTATPTPTDIAVVDVPQPTPTTELSPVDDTAFAFLQAWEQGDYDTMYALLSPAAQARYSREAFSQRYFQVVLQAEMVSVSPRMLAAYQPGTQAEVTFAVTFQTAHLGSFEVQNRMPLSYQEGRWGVDWSPTLIIPQMSDESFVYLERWVPSRGNIYDRNGKALAVQGGVVLVEVGVVPGEIEDEAALLSQLSVVLSKPPDDIRALYADLPPDWYVYLGRVSAETAQVYFETLSELPGVRLEQTWSRSYYEDTTAPHVVGVVGPIPPDEVELWRERGYTGDEEVGRTGLEAWGEEYLAGQRGGRLEILTYGGQQVAVLLEQPVQTNSNLYTTFEREYQQKVQEILGQQMGAIVVLEVQTGRVLALVTYPLFDPNLFPTGISQQDWQALEADPRRPLVNRATQGTYPSGSTFKIVTMLTAMEAGGMTADSKFLCRGTWTGLGPQWPKYCWLRSGHGSIPLKRALTVSCDITFYEVGLALDSRDQALLPRYARLCGFGAPTGIEVEEDGGLVPDPVWKIQSKGEGWAPGDSVNLAIGQGELLVSPLQLASLLAAVGNGGTLYRPQVVEKIGPELDSLVKSFEPVVAGQLPVSAENLAVIQDSLFKVTSESYGTAYLAFQGFSIPVAGKTGTAESGQELPHSWFAGYFPADKPEVAIAVIVEHTGEGSRFAAPLFRKVVEAYYNIEPPVEPSSGTPPATTPTPEPDGASAPTAEVILPTPGSTFVP